MTASSLRLRRNCPGAYETYDGSFYAVRDESAAKYGFTRWCVGRRGEHLEDVRTLREARALISLFQSGGG